MLATLLDQALRTAGIPIVGVSIGQNSDRATWVVQFAPEATAAHRTDAAALVASVDVAPAKQAAAQLEAQLQWKVLRAIVVWLAQRFGITPQQAKDEIVAIYKTL